MRTTVIDGETFVECREIPDTDVPTDERETAARTLAHATAALGLPDITIRWFRPTMDNDDAELEAPDAPDWLFFDIHEFAFGWFRHDYPDEILVRSGMNTYGVTHVIAHECRHLWQQREWGKPNGYDETLYNEREADADAFAASVIDALKGS